MNIKVLVVGGRNDGRLMNFPTQESLDLALKNMVKARFMALRAIGVRTLSETEQECFVKIGDEEVTFAHLTTEGLNPDDSW